MQPFISACRAIAQERVCGAQPARPGRGAGSCPAAGCGDRQVEGAGRPRGTGKRPSPLRVPRHCCRSAVVCGRHTRTPDGAQEGEPGD